MKTTLLALALCAAPARAANKAVRLPSLPALPVAAAAVKPPVVPAAAAPAVAGAPTAATALAAAARLPEAAPAASLPEFAPVFDGAAPMVKPPLDHWTVDGTRYETTAELVAALPRSDTAVNARYSFRHLAEVSPRDHRINFGLRAVSGPVIGAVAAAVVFAILGVFASFTAPFFYMTPSRNGLDVFGFVAAAGAALGLMMAVMGHFDFGRSVPDSSLEGKIYRNAGPSGERLIFETSRGVAVDLAAYAQAGSLPPAAQPAVEPLGRRLLRGFAAGALWLPALFVPILNVVAVFAPTAYLAETGSKLGRRRALSGGVFGGAVGVLATSALLAGTAFVLGPLNVGGWALAGVLALWTAGLGALAAAVNAWLAPLLARAEAEEAADFPKEQWWARAYRGDAKSD